MNPSTRSVLAALLCCALVLGVSAPGFPEGHPLASEAEAAAPAHPALVLPSMFPGGFQLESDRLLPRPIAFLDRAGRELVYSNPSRPAERISVFVVTVPTASEAADHMRILSGGADLPRLEIASLPPQVKQLTMQQGRQENPAASTIAGPTPLTRVVAWRPPHLIYLLAQSDTLPPPAIIAFLSEMQ